MYKDWAKKAKLPNPSSVVTNDPMEATYIGIHMWKQAVEAAGTTDVDKVIAAVGGQTFKAPNGFEIKMPDFSGVGNSIVLEHSSSAILPIKLSGSSVSS